jgi:3-dehydroquinate dehydratase / shikimate dehydrogenase
MFAASRIKMRQLKVMPNSAISVAPITAKGPVPAPAVAAVPRLRLPKLCVSLGGATPAELLARAEDAIKDARFLEFRLDALAKPAAALPQLKDFLNRHRDVMGLATCRRKEHGGGFTGSLTAELEILLKAAEAGCQIVDLEVESAEQANRPQLARFRAGLRAAGASLLVSFHDFSRTKGLNQAAERINAFKPDYVKLATTARTLADNLAVLRMIEDQTLHAQVIGIAMGEEGLVSRVLGPRAGAAFTFASANEGAETAPGQVSVRTLTETYRMEQLDTATRIFGVAGNPIGHSLSPLMHNTAFRRENVNAVMLPLKVKSLTDLLTLVRELPVGGVAVTMPLKQEVLPHLTNMDPLTAKIGACNTLRTGADGNLYGFNTDVAGVVRPLERRLRLKGARVLVLGAGGAARAAVFGLVEQGAEVFITNRTHETAVSLARKAKAKALKRDLLAKNQFDVVINTTPCGMAGVLPALPIGEKELNARLVFDMVYTPIETPLLKMARARGMAVISGLEMFVQQGARQFEIWTGKPAPEAEMMRVVELALRKRPEPAQPAPVAAKRKTAS